MALIEQDFSFYKKYNPVMHKITGFFAFYSMQRDDLKEIV